MGEASQPMRVTYAEYLALEQQTDRKHEWLDGAVYAMAGGTLAHAALSAAIIGELRAAASRRGCTVLTTDGKIRVPDARLATYPDASVVCGPIQTDAEDPNALTNPVVLVEVLSDSTEAWDRGQKFAHFRKLASLRDYVLVSQHEQQIDHYYLNASGRWELASAEAGQSIKLTGMDAVIEVDRVYAGIQLTPAPPRPDGVK